MPKLHSLPYMQKFMCIADKCEDTCCQHWHVRVDRLHYQRMFDWAQKDSTQKVIFSKSVLLNDSD